MRHRLCAGGWQLPICDGEFQYGENCAADNSIADDAAAELADATRQCAAELAVGHDAKRCAKADRGPEEVKQLDQSHRFPDSAGESTSQPAAGAALNRTGCSSRHPALGARSLSRKSFRGRCAAIY